VGNDAAGRVLVYQGSQGGAMSAYDAATGERVWVFKIPAHIQSSPAVVDNVLYFGGSDRNFYALNATTGGMICKANVGGVISASPTVVNPDGKGLVAYFGDNGVSGNDDGGHVFAYNAVDPNAAADCSRKWAFNDFGDTGGSQPDAGSWSPPAFARDRDGRAILVVGGSSPDCAIYALDAVTGQRIWRVQTQIFNMDNDVGAGATISAPGVNGFADGVAYIAGKNRIVYALNLRTGAEIWKFSIRADVPRVFGATRSTPAIVGNRIYIGYGAGVYALDARTGAKVWRSNGGTEVISSPAVTGAAGDQVLFVGDLGGAVRGLRLSDGQEMFSYQTGAFVYGSAAVSRGRVYIASSNGLLFAFAAQGTSSAPPETALSYPTEGSTITNPSGPVTFSGTASDDVGVNQVQVAIKNRATSKWWSQATQTWVNVFTPNPATLGPASGGSRSWTYSWPAPPDGGDFLVQAEAVDGDGQHDTSVASAMFTVTALGGAPETTLSSPTNMQIFRFPGGVRQEFDVPIAGTATDSGGTLVGVRKVFVTIKNREHGDYYCATCTPRWQPTVTRNVATLTTPNATSTQWRLNMRTYDHPHSYHVQAWAQDRDNKHDTTRAILSRFCVKDAGDNTCT
jgi:outer membrane protein assembly factor BamB